MQINRTQSGWVTESLTRSSDAIRSAEQTSTGRTSKVRSSRLPHLERLSNWSLIGATQQKIADAQGSEQALLQVYRQLKQLERQLSQSQQAGSQIREQLAKLDQELAGDEGPLNSDLTPKLLDDQPSRRQYRLDKVDLLTPKASAEKVRLFFPSAGQGVNVEIAANSRGEQVVDQLQQALADTPLQVSRNDQGQLLFSVPSGDARWLDEPVLFSGEGIRVPAGNPVSIKLSAEQGELTKLGDGLSRGESRQEQQRLQKLLGTIESSMRELKKYRRQMLAQLERVKERTTQVNEQELQQLQQELQRQLSAGDFQQGYSALVTQANVSRQDVVALLS